LSRKRWRYDLTIMATTLRTRLLTPYDLLILWSAALEDWTLSNRLDSTLVGMDLLEIPSEEMVDTYKETPG